MKKTPETKKEKTKTKIKTKKEGLFFNLDQLIETQFMNDREFFCKIAEQMIADHHHLLKSLHIAIANHQWKELEKSAHKIKGILEIFSDQPSMEYSQRLEELGRKAIPTRDSSQTQKAQEDLSLLQKRVKNLCHYLKGLLYSMNKA